MGGRVVTWTTWLRAAGAVAAFAVLPGLAWSHLLGEDPVERAGLAVGLSVAATVVLLHGAHLLVGQPMTLVAGLAVVAGLVLVAGGIVAARRVPG